MPPNKTEKTLTLEELQEQNAQLLKDNQNLHTTVTDLGVVNDQLKQDLAQKNEFIDSGLEANRRQAERIAFLEQHNETLSAQLEQLRLSSPPVDGGTKGGIPLNHDEIIPTIERFLNSEGVNMNNREKAVGITAALMELLVPPAPKPAATKPE